MVAQHSWVYTDQSAPPDAYRDIPEALGERAPRITLSTINDQPTNIKLCARFQRLRFGGVCRLRSTPKSGEHHG